MGLARETSNFSRSKKNHKAWGKTCLSLRPLREISSALVRVGLWSIFGFCNGLYRNELDNRINHKGD